LGFVIFSYIHFLQDYFLTGATTVLTVSFLATAGLAALVDFLTAGLVALTVGLVTVSQWLWQVHIPSQCPWQHLLLAPFLATVVAGLTVPVAAVAVLVVCALTANTVRATVRVINSFFIFLSVLFFFLCNIMSQNNIIHFLTKKVYI
jgi:hypothetical protein